MSKNKKLFLCSFFPSILLIIIYSCLYRFLPNQVINHIDISGNVTMGNKSVYLYLMFIPLLISLLITWISFINHTKSDERYKRIAFNNFISSISLIVVFLFVLFVQLSSINVVLATHGMHIICSIVIIVLGLLMPKFKRGYAIGIRTWWTIASEEVWIKTHKLAQITVTISGVIMLCIIFVINNLTLFYLCWILSLLVGMIIPSLYSAYLYNKEKNNGKDYFQNKNL